MRLSTTTRATLQALTLAPLSTSIVLVIAAPILGVFGFGGEPRHLSSANIADIAVVGTVVSYVVTWLVVPFVHRALVTQGWTHLWQYALAGAVLGCAIPLLAAVPSLPNASTVELQGIQATIILGHLCGAATAIAFWLIFYKLHH